MRFNPINTTLDFNGDNRADIYWRNDQTNQNALWLMNGPRISKASFLPDVPEEAGWAKPTFGDFNGDSKTDFLWRNTTTGANVIWLMDGDRIASSYFITTVPVSWDFQVADFNGDGTTDLFWRNKSTGETAAWTFRNGNLQEAKLFNNVPAEWQAFIADFNGDGKTDLFWRNTNSGQNAVWTFNGLNITQTAFTESKAVGWTPTIVDLNGDNRTDIFWHNSTGENQVTFWSNNPVRPLLTINLPRTAIDLGIPSIDVQFRIADLGSQNAIVAYDPIFDTVDFWRFDNNTLVAAQVEFDVSLFGTNLEFADFDNDGTSDIWVYSRLTGEVAVNTSRTNFSVATPIANLASSADWREVVAVM
jgi:FG-GAP-like repeat